MERPRTRLDPTVGVEGERQPFDSAFPPMPPLVWDEALACALARAARTVGRLEGLVVQDGGRFKRSFVRREATLSARVSGGKVSAVDLFVHEVVADKTQSSSIEEAATIARALDNAFMLVDEGESLFSRFCISIYRDLTMQSASIKESVEDLSACRDIDGFLEGPGHRLPLLIRLGLAVGYATCNRPFGADSAVIGRSIVPMRMEAQGMRSGAFLCISSSMHEDRTRLVDSLDAVRERGDWEQWLVFFLGAVEHAAMASETCFLNLRNLVAEHTALISDMGRIAPSALRVFDALVDTPVCTAARIVQSTGLSAATVGECLHRFESLGLISARTSSRRNRPFSYDAFLKILDAE